MSVAHSPTVGAQNPFAESLLRGDLEHSYLLDLGAGLSWCVSGPAVAKPLLERLAHVLGMQPGNKMAWPQLVFGTRPVAEIIPAEGWMVTEFPDARIWTYGATEDVFCEVESFRNPNSLFRMWSLTIHSVFSRAIAIGGLPIHAALIEKKGLGIALVGASGRGKTTCCRRVPAPWRALSDDQALVLPTERGGFEALPFTTWGDVLRHDQVALRGTGNRVTLSAIFFLEQAPLDQVKSVGQAEAALRLNQSTSQIFGSNVEILEKAQPGQTRTRVFENACIVSKAVKTQILRVSLEGRFWDVIDDALS